MHLHGVGQPELGDLRAQRRLLRAAAQQVQPRLRVGRMHSREGFQNGPDGVIRLPAAQADGLEARLAVPGRGGEAGAFHAPVNQLGAHTGRQHACGGQQIGRVAGHAISLAQRPGRQVALEGAFLRRDQQVAAPGGHHQRVTAGARGQVAIRGNVMRVHQIGRQRRHRAPRRAHAPQPVGGAGHGRQHDLLYALDGLWPRRDQRQAPAARQHLARPALHVHAVGVAEQADVVGSHGCRAL